MGARWSRSRTTGDLDGRPHARPRRRCARGADVIYQACFVDGDWRGFADFVERQPDGGYEVVDTKLARHSKPAYVLQLCFYSEQVARIQGVACRSGCTSCSGRTSGRASASPTSSPTTTACASGSSRAVEAGIDVYPLPVSFCDRCDFQSALREPLARGRPPQPRRADAARPGAAARGGGHRDRRRARARAGRGAAARDGRRARSRRSATRRRCRSRRARTVTRGRCSPPEPARGFELLPPPSARRPLLRHRGRPVLGARPRARVPLGDRRHGGRVHAVLGARPRAGAAGGRGRDRPDPRAPRRRSGDARLPLRRLRGHRAEAAHLRVRHARGGARRPAARRGLRRPLQGRLAGAAALARALRAQAGRDVLLRAHADLRAGDDSIVLYEDWLERHDPAILDDDRRLQRGGLRLDARAARLAAAAAARARRRSPSRTRAARAARRRGRDRGAARRRCSPGCPTTRTTIAEADRPRWLLAQLLLYHRREEKPVWWAFFDRIGRTARGAAGARLRRDRRARAGRAADRLGQLARLAVHVPGAAAPPRRRATTSTTRRPASRPGRSTTLDEEAGTLRLRRGPIARGRAAAGARSSPAGPYTTPEQQAALRRLARSVLAGDERYPAAKSILVREPFPRAAPAGRPRRREASSSPASTAATS